MKKTIILLLLVFSLFSSCSKRGDEVPEDVSLPDSISTSEDIFASASSITSSTSSRTLTVSITTNRSMQKGKTFVHLLTVKSGGQPVSNYLIGVDDPIRGICTQVRTNSTGIVEYKSTIPSYTQPDFYQYRFYISNATPILSTVSVYDVGTWKTFPHVKVNMKSILQSNIDAKTMIYSARAANIGQSTSNSIPDINSTFGKDLYQELYSNPGSNAVMTVAAISCGVTPVFPPAGAVCIASARMSGTHLAISTVKTLAKRGIDRTNLSSSQKNEAKTLIDLLGVIHGIVTFKVDESLSVLTAANDVALLWDFKNLVVDLYRNSNGNLKGFHLVGQIRNGPNAGQMCLISSVKK